MLNKKINCICISIAFVLIFLTIIATILVACTLYSIRYINTIVLAMILSSITLLGCCLMICASVLYVENMKDDKKHTTFSTLDDKIIDKALTPVCKCCKRCCKRCIRCKGKEIENEIHQ